jgi:staphyloferrin B synthase
MTCPDPAELVLRDLVDTLLQENVYGLADVVRVSATAPELATPLAGSLATPLAEGERWCRVDIPGGWLVFRCRGGGALQPYRFARAPVWTCAAGRPPRALTPGELLAAVSPRNGTPPHLAQVAADLHTAVEHAAVTLHASAGLSDRVPRPGGLLAAERLAATRNRPFHPTARAVTGWSTADLERYGPMRGRALGMDWVAVRRDRLCYGSGPASQRLERCVLDDTDLALLADAARQAGVDLAQYQPLPVHPWQLAHVLPGEFADEWRARDLVPLVRDLGRFHPTSSLRTLTTCPESDRHLKLPLGAARDGGGVTTIGAARLLPPRCLDNAERAQRTMQQLLDRDQRLAGLVSLCDERSWCAWRGPGAGGTPADPPGQLAAQVRAYPTGLLADPDALVMPMAALAAQAWDILRPALSEVGFDVDPVGLFRMLAEALCELGLGFLRYGVLPELHGQNVVVVLAHGRVRRFVLRDHDTLRLYPEWMRAQQVPDPGYRIKPGAVQSLRLPSPQSLLGYLQTLGFQVNLYGIADALARHHDLEERLLWSQLRAAVIACLDRLDLPGPIAEVVDHQLLRATWWPSRQVLGPLLHQGRSAAVSMPAATGRVPNPLLPTHAAVA